jgi:hypothetical protein
MWHTKLVQQPFDLYSIMDTTYMIMDMDSISIIYGLI